MGGWKWGHEPWVIVVSSPTLAAPRLARRTAVAYLQLVFALIDLGHWHVVPHEKERRGRCRRVRKH